MLTDRTLAAAAAAFLALPTVAPLADPLAAQGVAVPASRPAVRAALETIRADNAWTLDQQEQLCEIPAPPFKEQTRAADLAQRFRAVGLDSVRIDAEGNVIAARPGVGNGPTVVLSGHIDTVFPEGTDVTVTREGTRMRGPGIGDDCRGLAVLLAVARAFEQHDVRTEGPVLFVGTVGEEGAGNLRGVRHLFQREMPGEIDYFISVDGTGFGVTSRAVGSHRYRVAFRGPGGHSFGDFGMPNPLHALGRAIAKISDLQVPREPRTTFSVGIVEGGTSVNSIAAEGTMDVDLRSESPAALAALDTAFRRAVAAALAEENARWPGDAGRLTVEIDTIGIRPAGSQPDSARIVQAAQATLRELGKTPGPTIASSTDANIPLSIGVPAITIDGGGRGAGAHSLDEWYDDAPDGHVGAQWAALIALALAGVR